MDRIDAGAGASTPLSADQETKLKKLHAAAQQLEGVFVDLLFKEMRKAQPEVSLTGKVSPSEKMFEDMLDEKRADQLSQTGNLGIAKVIEQQLRATVIGASAPPPTPGETKP